MSQPPRPHLNAILLCDNVHVDPGTGKYFVLGTFDRMWVPSLPHVHPFCALFVNFSDAEGEYKARIEVVYLDEEKVIAEFTMEEPVLARDRLGSHNLRIGFQGMTFEKSGKYAIRVYLNDLILGEGVFHVMLATEMGGEAGES